MRCPAEKYELPEWSVVDAKRKTEDLGPIEHFIYSNEPAKEDDAEAFRTDLLAAFEEYAEKTKDDRDLVPDISRRG